MDLDTRGSTVYIHGINNGEERFGVSQIQSYALKALERPRRLSRAEHLRNRPFARLRAFDAQIDSPDRFVGASLRRLSRFQLEDCLSYNWHRTYDPTLGRYAQADPLGFVDGPGIYNYAGLSPVKGVDPFGLESGVTIWEPYGWGASFGYAALDIDGTNFSFGPNGMNIEPTPQYRNRNGFGAGAYLGLNLTPDRERKLTA